MSTNETDTAAAVLGLMMMVAPLPFRAAGPLDSKDPRKVMAARIASVIKLAQQGTHADGPRVVYRGVCRKCSGTGVYLRMGGRVEDVCSGPAHRGCDGGKPATKASTDAVREFQAVVYGRRAALLAANGTGAK